MKMSLTTEAVVFYLLSVSHGDSDPDRGFPVEIHDVFSPATGSDMPCDPHPIHIAVAVLEIVILTLRDYLAGVSGFLSIPPTANDFVMHDAVVVV
jgi:hypothetical protein